MKELTLTDGSKCQVDDDVYVWASTTKWSNAKGYASFSVGRECYILHREIMKAPDGMQVDHIDGNPLNNQRSNLRLATRAQNQYNSGPQKNNTTGYKGVFFHGPRYMARIKFNKQRFYLGSFDCPIEAAKAYDKKAKELHKEFAKLNFPDDVNS